jgi:hypothetical protein
MMYETLCINWQGLFYVRVSFPFPSCLRLEGHPLLAFQKCLLEIISSGLQYLHLICSLMVGCMDLTIKRISVAIISSNTNIIEEDVHWVPLAHDVDQNLTKWANIFSTGTTQCRWFTYISKQVRSCWKLRTFIKVMHFINEVNGLRYVIHDNSWAL